MVIWVVEFSSRVDKTGKSFSKNQYSQQKLLNFENWSKTLEVNFLRQKSSKYFSFFSLKNINLGAHFLLLTFFDNINF